MRRELRYLVGLRVLPRRVALFDWRAHRLASQIGDEFSLVSATRPPDLALLLRLARGRRRVVEIGTGTGWTALALALQDPHREVITYDPVYRAERERYLELVDPGCASASRSCRPRARAGRSTSARSTCSTWTAPTDAATRSRSSTPGSRALAPGALVILDDFTHPDFPGVREAVQELGLSGRQRGTLFVHGGPPVSGVRLDHCAIGVSDWEAANRFWSEVVGAELVELPRGLWAYRFGDQQVTVHGPGATP